MRQWDITAIEQKMKKIFLFTLALICSVVSLGQSADDWRVHPNDAQYYIKGIFDVTTGTSATYTLTNVETKGVTLKDPRGTYYGAYQDAHDDVMFTFNDVETTCPTKYDYISYWVYDEEINEWQPDVEIRSADRGMEHRKIMTVMLVLDCSSSLENEFVHDLKYVKEGAKTFLRTMYDASHSGNIRIGIIGFNSLKRTSIREIQPLTEGSYLEMVRFVDNFDVANGTALYYSLDKALDMTEKYTATLGSADNYVSPIIVTFTDGVDQTSFDNKKGIKNADSYYNVVLNGIKKANVEHFVVPFLGSDIKTEAQKEKFERVLRSLTKPNDNHHYLPVRSMSELGGIFGSIANNLVDRWQILRCYVAPARQGKVCWTFGKKGTKPAPIQPVVKNGRNIFVGLNGTIGIPMGMTSGRYYSGGSYSYFDAFAFGMNIKFGVDFAYPVADKFAIGTYMNIGAGPGMLFANVGNSAIGPNFDFKVGLLMLAGDVNDRPFIIGLSPCLGFGFVPGVEYLPIELRFGRITKKHLYVTGNLNIGLPLYGNFMIEPGITIGYHFGDKLKTKR